MLTVYLRGGLGNQLFELAGLDTLSKQTNRSICMDRYIENNPHSTKNYFESIFLEWKKLPYMTLDAKDIYEREFEYHEWKLPDDDVRLVGYFQDYRYVSDSFLQSLWLPNVERKQGAFLHIRGGDYINHNFHFVDLTEYYNRAICMFPPETKFYIFTNDTSYAKTLPILKKINYEFIEEQNEIVCLTLMKNCTLGGICSNSTFAWWGAYLDRTRTLVLPSRWFNEPPIENNGYFFPEAIRCPV